MLRIELDSWEVSPIYAAVASYPTFHLSDVFSFLSPAPRLCQMHGGSIQRSTRATYLCASWAGWWDREMKLEEAGCIPNRAIEQGCISSCVSNHCMQTVCKAAHNIRNKDLRTMERCKQNPIVRYQLVARGCHCLVLSKMDGCSFPTKGSVRHQPDAICHPS